MATAYKTETEEYQYERTRRKRRKRRRWTLLKLAAVALVAFGAYKLVNGFIGPRQDHGSVPMENIVMDFNVNTKSLAVNVVAMDKGFTASPEDIASLQERAASYPEYKEYIDFLIEHIDAYSQEAVNSVLMSPEKVEFVLMEPFILPDDSGVNTTIKAEKGQVPYLLQYDSRWAFHEYGSSVAGYTACGPTCFSMVAIGLTGDTSYTPAYVSDFAMENGYYVPGAGTSWALFSDGAASFGIRAEVISLDSETMRQQLDAGHVIITSMTPGDFTMAGHFIVIYDYDDEGFRVYDPSSIERSEKSWSFSELQPQIAQIWSFSEI